MPIVALPLSLLAALADSAKLPGAGVLVTITVRHAVQTTAICALDNEHANASSSMLKYVLATHNSSRTAIMSSQLTVACVGCAERKTEIRHRRVRFP